MAHPAQQFDTGQLRALVADACNLEEAQERQRTNQETQYKPPRLPAIIEDYETSERSMSLTRHAREFLSTIRTTIDSIVVSRAIACKYNGHKVPRQWTDDYPRCLDCKSKITTYEEAGPAVQSDPQRSSYWIY